MSSPREIATDDERLLGAAVEPGTVTASVSVLGLDGAVGGLVLALDGLEDALGKLEQDVRRDLGVHTIDVVALQLIDRRQRRDSSTRVGDLVAPLGISSGGATSIVQRLERAGLVECSPDQTDGRGRVIELAARAHELTEGRLGPIRTDFDALIRSLGPDQETELLALLDRVRAILTRT